MEGETTEPKPRVIEISIIEFVEQISGLFKDGGKLDYSEEELGVLLKKYPNIKDFPGWKHLLNTNQAVEDSQIVGIILGRQKVEMKRDERRDSIITSIFRQFSDFLLLEFKIDLDKLLTKSPKETNNTAAAPKKPTKAITNSKVVNQNSKDIVDFNYKPQNSDLDCMPEELLASTNTSPYSITEPPSPFAESEPASLTPTVKKPSTTGKRTINAFIRQLNSISEIKEILQNFGHVKNLIKFIKKKNNRRIEVSFSSYLYEIVDLEYAGKFLEKLKGRKLKQADAKQTNIEEAKIKTSKPQMPWYESEVVKNVKKFYDQIVSVVGKEEKKKVQKKKGIEEKKSPNLLAYEDIVKELKKLEELEEAQASAKKSFLSQAANQLNSECMEGEEDDELSIIPQVGDEKTKVENELDAVHN